MMHNPKLGLRFRVARKIQQRLFPYSSITYSQCGEDSILRLLLGALQINQPTYLDVGANHPIRGNNTYIFYHLGSRGVCVEPNPRLFEELSQTRPGDKSLNVGVASESTQELIYHDFGSEYQDLNTFSPLVAAQNASFYGAVIKARVPIKTISLAELCASYFNRAPNLLSIDVEGLEAEILKTFDFSLWRFDVICIETLKHIEDRCEKDHDLISLLESKGYRFFADTFINTIFVSSKHRVRI